MPEHPKRPVYELVNHILNGGLEPTLRKWRNAGVSSGAMSALLHDEIGVEIHRATLMRWVRELPDEKGAAA